MNIKHMTDEEQEFSQQYSKDVERIELFPILKKAQDAPDEERIREIVREELARWEEELLMRIRASGMGPRMDSHNTMI